MKKLLLMGLLIGGLGCQTASAKIRTFDFTGVLGNLVSNEVYPVQSAPGIVDGSVVNTGDLFTGEFSFDDAELDWTIRDIDSKPAISLTITFADGTSFSAPRPEWSSSVGFPGHGWFGIYNGSDQVQANPHIVVSINSYLPFRWHLGPNSSAATTFSWSRPGVNTIAMGNRITSLTERGVSPIPEPSSYAMLLLGVGVMAGAARRKQRKAAP